MDNGMHLFYCSVVKLKAFWKITTNTLGPSANSRVFTMLQFFDNLLSLSQILAHLEFKIESLRTP